MRVELAAAARRPGAGRCRPRSSRSWPYQRKMRERMRNSYSGGTHARQRDQHRDDRHQHHPHAVDQVGEPERQVALQQRRAAAVEALGLLGQRQLGVARRSGSRPCAGTSRRRRGPAAPPARTAAAAPGACVRAPPACAVGATRCTSRGGMSRARSTTPRGSVTGLRNGEAARVGLGLREVEQPRCPASAAASAPSATRAPRRTPARRSRRRAAPPPPASAARCSSVERWPARCGWPRAACRIRLRHAAAGRADVDAPARQLRPGCPARRSPSSAAPRPRGRTATPARRTGCPATPAGVGASARRRPCSRSAPPCTKARSTPEAGSRSSARFSAEPCVAAQLDLDAVALQQLRRSACRTRRRRPASAPVASTTRLRRRRVEHPVGEREQQQRDQHERPGGGQQVANRQQRVAQDLGMAGHSGRRLSADDNALRLCSPHPR